MLHTLKRLTTALDYLRIEHQCKRRYDIYLPGFISALFIVMYVYIPFKPPIISESGIVSQVTKMINILTGFYIASLAAVATFKSDLLDEVMSGSNPPRLQNEILSRRRFLCLLFAYLVTLCFFLIFLGITSEFIPQNIKFIARHYYDLVKLPLLWGYFFLVFQLVIITLLGLYYIADKIHPKIISKNKIIGQVDPEDVEIDESDDFKM